MPRSEESPEWLLTRARAGDAQALGRLLDRYRNLLRIVARSLAGPTTRARADASDLVQETFLKAHREFRGFVGSGEPEVVAWLRKILARTVADQAKYDQRQRRNARQQESLDAMLDSPGSAVQLALAAPISSPSDRASRREQAVILADALARLPGDYYEVFVLRNIEHIPFDAIAARMGRSPGAVRKLWTRAMTAVKELLETSP
jgi:RNA polymerase sigma-70 factor (ECF subfamily)